MDKLHLCTALEFTLKKLRCWCDFSLAETLRRLWRYIQYVQVLSSQVLICWEESRHHTWNGWPFALRVLANILLFSRTWRKDMQSDWLQVSQQTTCGGIKIPCRLVFICSSEVKINSLKELLKNKWTQWWKRQWSTTTSFKFVIFSFSDILRSSVSVLPVGLRELQPPTSNVCF